MTVEILAHFEDMVEQLMIIRGYDKPSRVIEEAIGTMYAALPDEEKEKAIERMVEDGFNSGPGIPAEQVFAELFADLDLREAMTHSPVDKAA